MFANTAKNGMVFYDAILENLREAQERAAQIGADKVINGTVGSLTDGKQLVTFPSVDNLIPTLDIKKVSAYTPMQGLPPYREAMERLCFESYAPQKPFGSVAVNGGLGGIHHALVNYTEPGDDVVTSDWHWGAYTGIVKEAGRKLVKFRYFQGGEFDLESFSQTVRNAARKQSTVFLLLNTPANNPSGFSVPIAQWDAIIAFLNSLDRKVILFLDMAYLDMAPKENKTVFRKIDALDDHVLTIINYTISKTLAKYGLRCGTLTAIHRDEAVIQEMVNIIAISNRGIHGCVPSLGQYLTSALLADPDALASYYTDLEFWKNVLKKRSETFLSLINPDIVTPYDCGYFVSVKTDQPDAMLSRLKERNIFLVPQQQGIRVGICSVPEEKLPTLAAALNEEVDKS